MQYVWPDYYEQFACIGGACKHNCCIGWEIDIDPDTAAFYETVPGKLGSRLKKNISKQEQPHFILGEGERCPFLNGDNLCDIILALGEEHICEICTQHPRFHNELPGRLESGIGLCCEEAGRLILGKREPVCLIVSGEEEAEDELIALRDEVIAALQNRNLSIPQRIEEMLSLCGAAAPHRDMGVWTETLLSLERLDEAWTQQLLKLQGHWKQADTAGFDVWMGERRGEYEQFLVYLIYRHLANSFGQEDLAARASFAALGYLILHTMGAVIWTKTGNFEFEQQVELARLFSSEIEYSEENMDALLDELV